MKLVKQQLLDAKWHSMEANEVVGTLGSDAKAGLGSSEVEARRGQFGPNRLPEEKGLTSLMIFLNQFKSPLIYILVFAGIVTIYLQDYTDAAVIFAAVVVNTIVGYFQENKASQALSKLKKILKVKTYVLRDGSEREVLQEEVVPGDVVVLKPGDKVPADARLISAEELKVNEAALTGEWLPASKGTQVLSGDVPLADRDNMVYMGTVIESGEGKAVVVSTGIRTELGKVAALVEGTEEEQTPYQKRLAKFSRTVGILIAFLVVAIFAEGMLKGNDFEEMFTTSIAVAVAAIPEGLPIAMTAILAIGMQRILEQKGLVRKLASAETLGSTSVICTDKTGTLTEARMKVSVISTMAKDINFGSDQGETLGEIGKDKQSKESHVTLLKIVTSCSDAFIDDSPGDEEARQGQGWVARGRPTDRALLLAGARAGIFKEDIGAETPEVSRLPFDSVAKYSATLNRLPGKFGSGSGHFVIYAMGAPEVILGMCTHLDQDGKTKGIGKDTMERLTRKYEGMTKMGKRVLATAYKRVEKKVEKTGKAPRLLEEDMARLVFVGFIGMNDPVRPSVKDAIAKCKAAGMRTIVITGDNKLTAKVVAEEIGLKVDDHYIVEGRDLDAMSDEEFAGKVAEIQIYARVEPSQKLRIVKALQERGEVVAMTGDGINDAPALKQADIGVALGSGTDVAKEVSDLVLLSDSFSVIVSAVEEGRAIIDNIRKVITYLLSDSFSEVILIGGSILANLPLPVSAAQILWVNLIEDGILNIALALEPKEKDIMEKRPEKTDKPLLTKEMKVIMFMIGIFTDILLFALFFWLLGIDADITHIRTMIFVGLSIDSLMYIFSCKSLRHNLWETDLLSNKYLVAAWALNIVMLYLSVQNPLLQTFLGTVALSARDWAIVIFLGFVNIALIEATKYYFIKKGDFE